MGVLDSLWVRLGFAVDAKNLEKFEGMAQKARSTMLGLGAAVTGAAVGIGLFVDRAVNKLDKVGDFSEWMGIAARDVEALGQVALENDSSIESMMGSISNLVRMSGEAAAGIGRGAMFFKKWHLQAKNADGSTKDFNTILGDVIDKMATMDRAKRIALGQRLGFDMATIDLMSKGRENFERLRKEALASNPLTEENYRLAGKTEVLFKKARFSVELLNKRVAVALMPTVNKMLEKFIAWTRDERNVRKLTSALETVVKVLELVWRNVGKLGAVFGVLMAHKIGATMLLWASNAMAAAKSMGTLHAAGGLLKALLTGGLVAAIALVAEDLWVFYRGGESVTGLLLERFPFAVEQVKLVLVGLSAALLAITTGSGPLAALVLGIGGLTIAALELRDSWAPVMQWFEEAWDSLADRVAKFLNVTLAPARALAGLLGIEIPKLDEDNGATRKRQFNEAAFNRMAPYASLGGPMREDYTAPWSMFPQKGGASQTTNITGVNINLPNVTNPQEAARETARALTRLAHGGVGG